MINPIKPTIKTEFFPLLLVILTLTAAVYFYNNLPERIPTHWNVQGQVDAYGSGKVQSVVLPLVAVGIYILFLLLPYLDPKKERYEQFSKVYHIFKNLILGLFIIIFFITSFNGLGYNLPVGVIIPSLIGLLFIILGNYMGKIKMNWFMGIRTPWTLSSEEVWNKTHRLGGKLFILGGLLMISQTFILVSWRMPVFAVMIVILVFGTMGYSYWAFLKEKSKLNK